MITAEADEKFTADPEAKNEFSRKQLSVYDDPLQYPPPPCRTVGSDACVLGLLALLGEALPACAVLLVGCGGEVQSMWGRQG